LKRFTELTSPLTGQVYRYASFNCECGSSIFLSFFGKWKCFCGTVYEDSIWAGATRDIAVHGCKRACDAGPSKDTREYGDKETT
jgi:hypothetical protein